MNCTAHVRDGGCELWAPTQIPGAASASVAKTLGIPVERVTVHVTFLGGGFGRRLIQDYAVEAAQISREVGAPVQVVWTREDDIRHDYYRPAAYHVLQADPDEKGYLLAWRHHAAYFGYGSQVAQVAEVTASASRGTLQIDRVVCAIDCGFALNPLGVRAQMESAINFGLTAALKSEITVAAGHIQQSNFHDYEVLRMSEAPPVIEVHIVPSSDPPGGCGEPGVPPIAGALGNAIYAATGKRVRRLSIRLEGLSDG